MTHRRNKPTHPVFDSLPAHKNASVREQVEATDRLVLHVLAGLVSNTDQVVHLAVVVESEFGFNK